MGIWNHTWNCNPGTLHNQSLFSVWIFCSQWIWRETWVFASLRKFSFPKPFSMAEIQEFDLFFLRQGVPKVDDYSKPCVNLGEFHKNPPKFRIFDILNQFLVDIFDIFRHFLSFLEGELCQQIYEESDRTARHVWIWRGFGIAWNRKSEVWVYEAIGVWESKIHGKGSFSKGKFQPWGCDWFDRAVERVQKSRFDVWMCKSPPSVWIRLH